MMVGYRSGFGYDIHGLIQKPDGRLMLGGVSVAEGIFAQAHSDGDVLIHSLIDALLGAMNAGDIGEHFPDSDPQYYCISSLILLERTALLLRQKNANIINIDVTIILQKIKLKPFKEEIRSVISSVLNLLPEQINIKAKTKENFDSTGRGESIEAYSAVLLFFDKEK